MKSEWLTASDWESYERRERRKRSVPTSVRPYSWCQQCEHRGYRSRSDAKAVRRRHQRDRKGLSVFRCPHDDQVFHLGHRPANLTAGRCDRQQIRDLQLASRARQAQKSAQPSRNAGSGRAAA